MTQKILLAAAFSLSASAALAQTVMPPAPAAPAGTPAAQMTTCGTATQNFATDPTKPSADSNAKANSNCVPPTVKKARAKAADPSH